MMQLLNENLPQTSENVKYYCFYDSLYLVFVLL